MRLLTPPFGSLLRPTALLGAALLAAGLLTGCGGGGSSPASGGGGSSADDGNTLHLAQTAEPTTLDPALVEDGPTIELLMQIFEGLVQWTPENKVAPAIAKSWEVSKDGKTYTFHLRDDAKFHNGRAVTAEDFIYSITRSLTPELKSQTGIVYMSDIVGAREFYEQKSPKVAGLEAPDAHTLRIDIDAPKAYFIDKLTYPTAYAICKEAVEKTDGKVTEESMIGTGPFTLAEYQHGERLLLKANPTYWEGAPKLAAVERRILLDNNTRYDKFAAGELDLTTITMAQFRSAREDPKLKDQIKQFPRPSVFYLSMNQGAYAPFKDRRVRQAFAMAVDKAEIVRTIHEGVPKQANGIVPPGVPGYDESYGGLALNPGRAKQLLAEAGYKDGAGMPALTLSFRASEDDIRSTAVAVADQLKKNLGIPVELDEVEWGTFLARRNKGEMPFYFLRWAADYLDPQNFLSLMLHSKSKENTIGYVNPEFDRLCDEADAMQDAAKRLTLYRQAERIAIEDAPWIPIYFQRDVELWNPRVKGVEDSAMGHLPHKRTYLAPATGSG